MFDDEEDLEVLRLAALKTLQSQKKMPSMDSSAMSQYATAISRIQQHPPLDPYIPVAPSRSWEQTQYSNVGYRAPAPVPGLLPTPIMPPLIPLMPVSSPMVPSANNVQLSPRSAAFVSQNNDILARRKQAKSPVYNRSPGRWSRSPSPLTRKSYRRSISRSVSPKRRRSRSRSPRYNPRSPARRSPRRRSPMRINTNGRYRSANNSPIHRRRSKSPRKRSPNQTSGSPASGRRLKISRSFKDERDRKRRTPEKAKLKDVGKEKDEKRKSKSKSLSPAASLERILANMDEEYKISDIDEKAIDDDDLLAKIDSAEKEEFHSTTLSAKDNKIVTESTQQEKIDNDIEDELLASDDEDVLNADIDIDLFASEDSESENEGRFKSGGKTEKKTTGVVPFSKLTAANSNTSSIDKRLDDNRRRNDRRAEHKRDEKPKAPEPRTKVSSTITTKIEPKKEERRIIRRPITAPRDEDSKQKNDSSRKMHARYRLGAIVGSSGESKKTTVTSSVSKQRTRITWRSEKV